MIPEMLEYPEFLVFKKIQLEPAKAIHFCLLGQ